MHACFCSAWPPVQLASAALRAPLGLRSRRRYATLRRQDGGRDALILPSFIWVGLPPLGSREGDPSARPPPVGLPGLRSLTLVETLVVLWFHCWQLKLLRKTHPNRPMRVVPLPRTSSGMPAGPPRLRLLSVHWDACQAVVPFRTWIQDRPGRHNIWGSRRKDNLSWWCPVHCWVQCTGRCSGVAISSSCCCCLGVSRGTSGRSLLPWCWHG